MLLNSGEMDAIAYFQVAYTGFKRAEQALESISRFYNVGGHTICLKFAGDRLISEFTPALEHLATIPTDTPALTICIWDRTMPMLAANLIELVKLKWWDLLDPYKEIKSLQGDRIRGAFQLGSNILSLLDQKRNIALFWIEDIEQIPYWERGSPLQAILNWWTSKKNLQYVHAGAVGIESGGVLLVGKGGSGKSTTALACIDSELTYASDDYCLITNDPMPYVYSIYNTAKLKGIADLERFPHLANLISNSDRLDQEKAMIFLQKYYPSQVVKGFPLRAILISQITGKLETTLRKSSSMMALKAIAPSTMFQLSGTNQHTLQTISKLIKQLDCYVLELGTDIKQIPKVILKLLKSILR